MSWREKETTRDGINSYKAAEVQKHKVRDTSNNEDSDNVETMENISK